MNFPQILLIFFIWVVALNTFAKSDYPGSQAYNIINAKGILINKATGTLNYSYPLLSAPGILSTFSLQLKYQYSYQGRFGLPQGWTLDIDYVDKNTIVLNGSSWLIDPLWQDSYGHHSGLRYLNHHGIRFQDFGKVIRLDTDSSIYYRYLVSFKDGSRKLFSATGLLLLQEDRFGNKLRFNYIDHQSSPESARLESIVDNYGQVHQFIYEPSHFSVIKADGTVTKIYSRPGGVETIIDALGHQTKFTYRSFEGILLINRILTPEGASIAIAYNAVKAKFQEGDANLPVVSQLLYQDKITGEETRKIFYHHTADKNFTGYPGYTLSKDKDSLLESGDTTYRYQVITTQSDLHGDTPKYLVNKITFNYLHLPTILETLEGDKPYSRVSYTYNISPFKYARQTNYDKPSQKIIEMFNAEKQAYIPVKSFHYQYDNFGNTLSEAESIFDPTHSIWLNKKKVESEFYTAHFNLPKKIIVTDSVSGDKKCYHYLLSPDKKNIAEKITEYWFAGRSTDWTPWQKKTFDFDAKGRMTKKSNQWLEQNHPAPQLTTSEVEFHFDSCKSQLKRVEKTHLGRRVTQIIDSRNNQLIKRISPAGAVTAYKYNPIGQLIEKRNALGDSTTFEYLIHQHDKKNAIILTSPEGNKTKITFDHLGRKTHTYYKKDNAWAFYSQNRYNGFNKIIEKTNRLGLKEKVQYDALQRPIKRRDCWGNEKLFIYDDAHFVTDIYTNQQKIHQIKKTPWSFSSVENRYSFKNDTKNKNQPITSKKTLFTGLDQVANVRFYEYDLDGTTTKEKYSESYEYNAAGKKVRSHTKGFDGIRSEQAFTYDIFGNMAFSSLHYKDKTGEYRHQSPRYLFNEDNLFIMETAVDPTEGQSISRHFDYDDDGNLIKETNGLGESSDFGYNPLGNVISSSWLRKGKSFNLAYDYNKDGKLIYLKDSNDESISYQYSSNNQLVSILHKNQQVLSFAYDDYDRLTKQTDPFGKTLHFHYDEKDRGKLSAIEGKRHTKKFRYGDDSNGLKGRHLETLTEIKNNESIIALKTLYSYGEFGLPDHVQTFQEQKKILDLQVIYDSELQLSRSTTWWINEESYPRTHAASYRYDSLKRLVAEIHQTDAERNPLTDKRYQYDGNNNLLQFQESSNQQSKVVNNTFNGFNQLITIKENEQVFHQSYDLAGRLITDKDGNQYSYDAQNFLMSIQQPGNQTIDLDYYPTGLLKKRQSPKLGLTFYYDAHANIIAEQRNAIESSLYRVNRTIQAIESLNEVTPVLSSNTSVKASFSNKSTATPWFLDGYGQLQNAKVDPAISNYTWLQTYTDFDTHLTYLNSRFFLQTTRQFLTPDKLPGMNAYNFAAGNPLSFPDLSGFSPTNYALGSAVIGLSAASILWSIFAAPVTGGGSLVASSAAVLSGVLGITSGGTLIASQALADQGNTTLSKALTASSIGLGVGAAVIGIGGSYFAPEIADAIGLPSAAAKKTMEAVSSASLSGEITQAADIEKLLMPMDNLAPDPGAGDLSSLSDAEEAVAGSADVGMQNTNPTPMYLEHFTHLSQQGDFNFANFFPIVEYQAIQGLGVNIFHSQASPLTQYFTDFLGLNLPTQYRMWELAFQVGPLTHIRARQILTMSGWWRVHISYEVYNTDFGLMVTRIISVINHSLMNTPQVVIHTLDSIPN